MIENEIIWQTQVDKEGELGQQLIQMLQRMQNWNDAMQGGMKYETGSEEETGVVAVLGVCGGTATHLYAFKELGLAPTAYINIELVETEIGSAAASFARRACYEINQSTVRCRRLRSKLAWLAGPCAIGLAMRSRCEG